MLSSEAPGENLLVAASSFDEYQPFFLVVAISVQSLLDGHIAFFSVKSASASLLGGHYGYN